MLTERKVKRTPVSAYPDEGLRRRFNAKLAQEGKKASPLIIQWIKEYLGEK